MLAGMTVCVRQCFDRVPIMLLQLEPGCCCTGRIRAHRDIMRDAAARHMDCRVYILCLQPTFAASLPVFYWYAAKLRVSALL